ncbi:MAG TPA: SDR family oxidoreductase, partial [Solirubrobacteraceae bacterium]|nr:SDR family oxidoreductase [Solirubrobacteraceae bacterium]
MALPPPTIDSTVVVTGASAGIGAELARELAERAYNLVLVARRAEPLDALAGELRLTHGVHVDVEPVDLADAPARVALVARLEAGEREVVGVCNDAGFGSIGRFADLPLEREQDIVRVNVEALHHLTGAFLPRMVEQGIGAILNVASTAAFQPLPGFATYAASKAFVQSFSEAVHAELAGTGVSVTCLSPGPTRTRFGKVAGLSGTEHA